MTDAPDLAPAALQDAAATYGRSYLSALETDLFGPAAETIRARGHLVKDDLADVCRWRSQKASGFVARNDPDEVVEISRLAFSRGIADRVRLKVLTLLDGVSERHAATLLALWRPDRYVPWDDAVATALAATPHWGDPSTEPTLPGAWPVYLGAVAEIAEVAGLDLRTAEKALFVLAGGAAGTSAAPGGGGGGGGGRGTAGGRTPARAGRSADEIGNPHDDAGTALLNELRRSREGVRDFDATLAKASETLLQTTPDERRLLLRLHRTMANGNFFAKASRDLGWLYYAEDVGKGLVGELALRMPRGVHEMTLVAYLPISVSTGVHGQFFTGASATQQKGHIPPADVDADALLATFETARRDILLR